MKYKNLYKKATYNNFLKWARFALRNCPNGNKCDLYLNLKTGNLSTLVNSHYRSEDELYLLSVESFLGEKNPSALYLMERYFDKWKEDYLDGIRTYFAKDIKINGGVINDIILHTILWNGNANGVELGDGVCALYQNDKFISYVIL